MSLKNLVLIQLIITDHNSLHRWCVLKLRSVGCRWPGVAGDLFPVSPEQATYVSKSVGKTFWIKAWYVQVAGQLYNVVNCSSMHRLQSGENVVAFPQCIASNEIFLYRLSRGLLVMKDTLVIRSCLIFAIYLGFSLMTNMIMCTTFHQKQCIMGKLLCQIYVNWTNSIIELCFL